jgi:molybdopterin-binding protein
MLRLENINKAYTNFSLKSISLDVDEGDYYLLLGKSGSGKSMLLEIITGIRTQDSGKIFLNDNDISRFKIQDRNCILVYQDTNLFPHMTVYENIAFTLKSHKIKNPEAKDRIMQMASFVSIEHLLNRMPAKLSGGEAQRAALARALVVKPDLLLLDEPLSALDVQLRGELQSLLRKINQAGQTIIQVTHDFEEAISLSNKISVIDDGMIIQSGTTEEVFKHPRNEFVAGLSGVKNFYKAVMSEDCTENGLKLIQPFGHDLTIRVLTDASSGEGYLTFSSKDVFIAKEKTQTSAVNNFSGTVVDIIPRGNGMEVIIDAGIRITVLVSKISLHELEIEQGKTFWISFKASACRFIRKK